MPGAPFDIDLPADMPLRRAASVAARPLLRWALRLNTFGELYQKAGTMRMAGAGQTASDSGAFARVALRVLDIRSEFSADDTRQIPAHGALIVAANHPHGAVDGLILLDLISRVRQDVRLIANHMLARLPELRDMCFFVDPFERHDSMKRTLPGLRAAHLWLRRGGAVIVFPSGEVAHARTAEGVPVDSPWRTTVGRLATATGAAVVPVHISGANSPTFYAAGRVHPLLRSVLLARELLKKRGCSLPVCLGRTLSPKEVATDDHSASTATERIRAAVEALRGLPPVAAAARTLETDVTPTAPGALAADVSRLPMDSKLLASGAFDVYCAEARSIPRVLAEIGRLRERTFRAVGEGTGKPADLDAFDASYLHLFVWNRERSEVVGAYRIGRSDQIVASAGVAGLYTRSLFRFDEKLIHSLPPALELGRSFVRQEYQRDPSGLMLLWKGICAFVQRHPQYRVLFGAVSVSARYSDRTRAMLMQFLEQNHLDPLSEYVAPRRPYPVTPSMDPSTLIPRTIEAAEALTSQFEGPGRPMPVLLRQYLKLNARALGFSVDPSFGDALDALMMVDLLRVDIRILRRYFGRQGADAFLEHHLATSHAA
jgi:putative hemolysin